MIYNIQEMAEYQVSFTSQDGKVINERLTGGSFLLYSTGDTSTALVYCNKGVGTCAHLLATQQDILDKRGMPKKAVLPGGEDGTIAGNNWSLTVSSTEIKILR